MIFVITPVLQAGVNQALKSLIFASDISMQIEYKR